MINLINGNCYEEIKNIPDNSIDLIVTDPPYFIENTTAGGHNDFSEGGKKTIQSMNDELSNAQNLTEGIDLTILDEFCRVMKNINIYIWCNGKQIPDYIDYFVKQKGCNFDILIWWKNNAMPLFSNKYLTDKEYCLYFRKGGYCNPASYEQAKTVYIQPINANDKKLYSHPTIKPLNIISNLVENSSQKGDTVLDCFMGSGTTGVACKELERNFIGIELDKKYFDIASDRINGVNVKQRKSNVERVSLWN